MIPENVTPLWLLGIALTGIVAWIQLNARQKLKEVEGRLERERGERQKDNEKQALERQQLWANHSVNDRLIETLNQFRQSGDARDSAHINGIKELTTAISNLTAESRKLGTEQSDILTMITENLKLQNEKLSQINLGNGHIGQGVSRLEAGQTQAVATITSAITSANANLQAILARIEDELKAVGNDHKGNRHMLEKVLGELTNVKEILSAPPIITAIEPIEKETDNGQS